MLGLITAIGGGTIRVMIAEKVWNLHFGIPTAPVILGVATAIGGGLGRDVLAGRTTLQMRPELYATPVLLGCGAFVLVLEYLPDHRAGGALMSILVILGLRAAAIHWNLTMPAWARLAREQQP